MFQCGASVAEGCSALNQHRVFHMYSTTFQILHFNIELTVVIASNKSESRHLKFQSICHNKKNLTIFKIVAKTCTKRGSNIIVT